MSPIALQVTELPDFALDWPERVTALVEAQLEHEVPSNELRTIVLALPYDKLRFGIWLGVEWEDYPYAGDVNEAAGTVGLDRWLDGLDGLARGEHVVPERSGWGPRCPVVFTDPARNHAFAAWWGQLHDALVSTAIEVATGYLAERFTQPVGVFVSMDGQEARLVGFCHPRGAPLWPLREHRKEHGYGSAYPHASLGPEAMTIFYPEGESEDGGAPTIAVHGPETIERAHLDDDDLYVRWQGELESVRFSAGHTHEEAGGPDRAQVEAALAAWAKASGRLEAPGEGEPPAPTTSAELDARLQAAGQGEVEQAKALIAQIGRHGLAAVAPLVSGLVRADGFGARLHRAVATEALDAGNWALALEQVQRIEGKDRWAWIEARALIGLGRWQEALPLVPEKDVAERALILAGLGQTDEALARLESPRDGDGMAVKAHLLASTEPEAALKLWNRALVERPRGHILHHARAHPAFAVAEANHRATVAAIEAARARMAAAPALPAPWSGHRSQPLPPPTRVYLTPLGEPDEDLGLRLGVEHRGEVWAADRSGGLFALELDAKPRLLHRFPAGLDGLLETEHGVVALLRGQLHLLDADGCPRVTHDLPWRGGGPLAVRGHRLAAATRDVVHLLEIDPNGFRPITAFGVPGTRDVQQLGFTADGELLITSPGQLVAVGLESEPEPRWRIETEARLLSTADGCILLDDDEGGVIVARWRDGHLDVQTILPRGYGPCPALLEAPGLAWRGGLLQLGPDGPTSLGTLGPDGYPLEPRLLSLRGEQRWALTGHGLFPLRPVELLDAAFLERTEARIEPVAAWLEQEILARGEDSLEFPHLELRAPLGGVLLDWSDDAARLSLYPPTSVVGLGYGDGPRLEWPEAESEDEEAPERDGPEQQQHDSLRFASQEAMQAHLRDRARAVLRHVGPKMTGRLACESFLLALQGALDPEVVEVLDGGGTSGNRRLGSSARPPEPLAARLRRSHWYNQRANWAARARVDAAFRAELLEVVCTEPMRSAQRVALDVAAPHLDEVAEAFLGSSGSFEALQTGLCELAERGHPGVRAHLGGYVDQPPAATALAARLALGRIDEDEALPWFERRLGELERASDLPSAELDALSIGRAAALKAVLLETYARLGSPDGLRPALARAGWAPDADSLERARSEMSHEDDLFASHFDDESEASAKAVRIWTSLHVRAALPEGPLWPADRPLEARRIGWRRFFDLAWPLWEEAGVLPALLSALPHCAQVAAHQAPPGPDARFAFECLQQSLLRGHPEAAALGEALASVPYPEDARAEVFRLARLGRVSLGWSLLKAGRYPEARRIADAALADGPEDGQVHFFAARLDWLQADDPQAALPGVERGLERAQDGVGRARLENLRGAALDALGQPEAALESFRVALAINESAVDVGTGQAQDRAMSASIQSNIAEALWKLGRSEAAREAARAAARRGAHTDVVQMILAAD